MSLAFLPDEIWVKIFGYLDFPEAFTTLEKVCQRFKELSLNPVFWKSIKIDKKTSLTLQDLELILRRSHLLKYFAIPTFARDHELFGHCQYLAIMALTSCPQLEYLGLESMENDDDTYFYTAIAAMATHLSLLGPICTWRTLERILSIQQQKMPLKRIFFGSLTWKNL